MDDHDWLAERFEAHRGHLRAVAYRMLGSLSEADDAVQECWLRLHRSDTSQVTNLPGWLTTVVARVSLDMLRARRARREQPLGLDLDLQLDRHRTGRVASPAGGPIGDPVGGLVGGLVGGPVGGPVGGSWNGSAAADPEQAALLADSIGPALQVVLDTLAPPERLAFVLHDIFAVPFNEIALILDRSPAAAKQLASRARRRVQGAAPPERADLTRQRAVVDAFLAAARNGEFDELVALLDPEVVLRSDAGGHRPALLRGAAAVAQGTITFGGFANAARPALVGGGPGLVVAAPGWPSSVVAFTLAGGKIVEIDIINNQDRIRRLDLTVLDQ